MPDLIALKELFASARAGGSRSSALAPIGWALGLVLTAFVACVRLEAATWVLVAFVVAAGCLLATFLVGFVFFMMKDSDALRSERFVIQKMAVQRGLVGDDRAGLVQPADAGAPQKLPLLGRGGQNE